jgi:hypothetical protein
VDSGHGSRKGREIRSEAEVSFNFQSRVYTLLAFLVFKHYIIDLEAHSSTLARQYLTQALLMFKVEYTR